MSRLSKAFLALCLLLVVPSFVSAEETLEEFAVEHAEENEEEVEEENTEDAAEDLAEEEHEEEEMELMSPEQLEHAHGKIDTNKDGLISIEEALDFSEVVRKHSLGKDMNALFAELDTNRDGVLEMAEYLKDMSEWEGDEKESKETQVKHSALEKAMFDEADSNKDGKLTEAEAQALFHPDKHHGMLELAAKATMEEKDLNKDGVLSVREFAKDVNEDYFEGPSKEEEELFKKLDKDNNGHIDVHELKRWEANHFHTELALHQLFELADKDKDGHLTAKELSGAAESMTGTDAHEQVTSWVEYLFR